MLGSFLLACARVSCKKGGLGQTGDCRNDGTARSPLEFQSILQSPPGRPPLKVYTQAIKWRK